MISYGYFIFRNTEKFYNLQFGLNLLYINLPGLFYAKTILVEEQWC